QNDQLIIEDAESIQQEKLLLDNNIVTFSRASYYGLIIINRAISKMGLTKLDQSWIKKANISLKTLDDFWNQLEIPEDKFITICQAVGIENWEQVTLPRNLHIKSNSLYDFKIMHTKITNAQILVETIQELGITVLIDGEVRGYQNQTVDADIVAYLEGDYDLGWIENSDGTFILIYNECILNNRIHDYIEIINSIHNQYFKKSH
ncbi:MAG: DUF1257 domain-containing protein, partial [Cyanobacteria bacterium P01_F01_bin.143]